MTRRRRLLADGERAHIPRLGLRVRALRPVQLGEVVQARRHFGMTRPQHLLAERQCSLRGRFRFAIFPLTVESDDNLVELLSFLQRSLRACRCRR
jgi:hypothetical protein